MEGFVKYIFYGVILVIYLVYQIRNVKNKQPQASAEDVKMPHKKIISRSTSTRKEPVVDFKRQKEVKKVQKRRKLLNSSSIDEVSIQANVSKIVASKEKINESSVKIDSQKVVSQEEVSLQVSEYKKDKSALTWIKDKQNLRTAFIASEIFNRKY